ncbi:MULTISPECIES: peptidoglycan DD-metalloendopeptidase family protein [Deinococcus]|uniref:Peptidoglycan DD-metalloendopeptidase family protein n=1 Tax=Deinococcus rufus TaxID=2136097 RepID=A0ABV7ZCM8_9DEIO|nr:peptidoglycan DD-metalloendopeptidase family protein [Deinococcus sp. AB2017081]WQE94037.1 peptidoglycan DD-metalloendopeptidase family protein [Deinococcus sp. AB2017081]
MAPSVADDILLRLNTQATGTADVQQLSRSITQLTAEMTATGNAAQVSETKLELIRDELLRTARGFQAGSREATQLAQAAAQVQARITAMGTATARATAETQRQAAAAARAATETQRQAAASQAAADAAAAQARAQAQANTLTARLGGLATDASAGLGTLRAGLAAVIGPQIIGGFRSLVSSVTGLTDEVNRANSAGLVFELTMTRFKVNVDDADRVAARLARTFGVSVFEIKDAMATMVRAGARDLGQLEGAMKGAGASAILAGRQAKDGFDGLAAAVATGLSNSLNGISVAENVGPALDKVAKAAGTTADGLSDVARASTVLGLVSRATATEVEALPAILNDYTRSQAESRQAAQELRQELGTALMPVVTTLTGEVTRSLQAGTDWARANRDTLVPSLKEVGVFLVDTGNALKVVLAFIGDLGTAVGGVGTVLVGFGLTVAGGLTGGIRAAVTEIKALFATSVDSLLAFQTAWNQLRRGDFAGAKRTIAEAIQANLEAFRAAPGNVVAGVQQGAQWGVETVYAGADSLSTVGTRTNTAITQGNASGARVRDALGLISLPEFLKALGVGGYRITQDFGATPYAQANRGTPGYEDGTHKGLDIGTPEGTRLYSPVSGTLAFAGWNKQGFGNLVKIIDEQGRSILLGHLKGLSDDLKKQLASGNKTVTAGQLLGFTGSTGNSSGPHLHLEVRDAQGRALDPASLKAGGSTAPSPPPTSTAPPPAGQPVTFTDAQITKARALQAAIDAAVKANDPKAWNGATAAMQRWEKQSEGNRAALDAVRATAQRTAQASRDATEEQIQGQLRAARTLAEEEARIKASGTRGEREALDSRVKAFTDGGVAQREALERARRALAGETQLREQQQRDQETAEREATARAKEQARIRAQIASEGRALTVSGAQQAAQRIQELNSQELAAFKGTAAERLKVVQRQSQDEYTARMRVTQAQRDAALRESANQGGPNQAERDRQIRVQYEQTRLEQQGVRLETVRQATAAVTQAQEDYTAALDEGTRAGNEALATLDRTQLGGRELAATAQTLIPAQTTFDALQIRIHALRADLSTPGVAEAWIASIEDMAKAGRLTAPQVAALKEQIVGLRDETATLIDLGGAVLDPDTGKLLFKTEAQVRGIGVAADGTTQNFFDLQNAIENVGRLSESELETLLQQSGLAADEAERLRAAWDALYGTLGTGPLLPDSLQGRGVSDGAVPGPEDPATGVLAAGEKDALLARMETMHLDDIGKVYAGLILKGVQDTPLGQLIGGYLRDQAQAIQDALLSDGGATQDLTASGERRGVRDESGRAVSTEPELTFLTDDQVRGIGQKTDTIGQDYYDLEHVIQNVMTMSRDEMTALMVTAGLLPAQIAKVTAAWEDFHQVADLPVAGIEARFEGWATKVDTLVADLDDGAISQEDFNRQALDTVPALERLAQAADARGFAELAGYYRTAAAGLKELVTGAGTVTQTLTTAEQQAADTTVSLLDLTTRYRDGAMGQQEFVTAAQAALDSLEQQAQAAERVGNTELAAYYRQLAAELRELGGAALTTAGGFQKFAEYAGYTQQLAGAFGKLAGATGNGDLEANFNGIANAAGQAIALAGDVARILANPADVGAWVGAITKVVSGIADAAAGYRRAREEAAKARKEFESGFKVIDASAFSSFTTRSRGFWADLFGGGPEVVKQIDETAATIARTIESGVSSGFTRGITNFLNGTGSLLDGIRDGIRGAVIDAITQAIIQGAIIKGTLGGLLTELTTTLAGGGDATSVITRIGEALPGVAQQLEATLTPLRRTIDAALPASSPSSGGSSPTLASNTGTLQTGTPTVVIDVLREARDLLRSANDTGRLLAEAARTFDGAVDRFGQYVDRVAGPHASSTAGAR